MPNSRSIGNKNERELAKLFTEWTGVKFTKTPASGGLRWGKDQRVTGDLVPPIDFDFPFSVEAKRKSGLRIEGLFTDSKKTPIAKFWDQACNDAKRVDKEPLLCFRSPGLPREMYFVVMRIELHKAFTRNKWRFTTYIKLGERGIVIHCLPALMNAKFSEVRKIVNSL